MRLLSALLFLACPAIAKQTLFDPRVAADVARLNVYQAKVSRLSPDWLAFQPTSSTAVVSLQPQGKTWDLSAFKDVAIQVANGGTEGFVVSLRLEDKPVSPDAWNCNTWWVWLEPGEQWTLVQRILRPMPTGLDLFGMRNNPGYFSFDPDAIDPTRVSGISLFLTDAKPAQILKVGYGLAYGRYEPVPKNPFPIADSFGQYLHSDWPGKTHSVGDLTRRRDEEMKELVTNPAPVDWDEYGGWKNGPRQKALGHFYPAKVDGKWWLVDPVGNLFFSQGLDVIQLSNPTAYSGRENWFKDFPGKDPKYAEFFGDGETIKGHYLGKKFKTFDFWQANLKRKYGDPSTGSGQVQPRDWKGAFVRRANERLFSWGFNTVGNWSSPEVYLGRKVPYTVALGSWGERIKGSEGQWGPFPDPFDPSFKQKMQESLKGEEKSWHDPWCLGYFADNEMGWADETSLAEATLASPPGQAAKKVFLQDLKSKYHLVSLLNRAWGSGYGDWPDFLGNTQTPKAGARADLLAFNRKIAATYFKSWRDAIRQVAPGRLYLGCRFADVNDQVAEEAAQYCDVLTYNYYRPTLTGVGVPAGSSHQPDKPVLSGEFHFGAADDHGMFDTGMLAVASQAERAKAFKDYVLSALKNPLVVGVHYFEYMDMAVTGRPLDEAPEQIGFVDIADTPYPEMVEAGREMGKEMYALRSKE
jgi:hypothetical protein